MSASIIIYYSILVFVARVVRDTEQYFKFHDTQTYEDLLDALKADDCSSSAKNVITFRGLIKVLN